jgi:hypothetical protein
MPLILEEKYQEYLSKGTLLEFLKEEIDIEYMDTDDEICIAIKNNGKRCMNKRRLANYCSIHWKH